MERNLKLILAALLFICLLDMPYGYYQLVRFFSTGVFCFLGYKEIENSNQNIAFIYFGLALLFQPFFKIALGRELWNIVDVVVGIALVLSFFMTSEKK